MPALPHAAPPRRAMTRVAAAVGVSALGDWLALLPLALVVESTGSGYAVAALFIALWGPSVLLAGHAGLLVDRLAPARVLIGVSLVQTITALTLALTFDQGTALLIGLVALLGCGHAVAGPAEFTLVAQLTTGDSRANHGRVETARYAGFTAGPLIGGALAAAGGTQAALLANAASFLVVIALVAPLARAGRSSTKRRARAAATDELAAAADASEVPAPRERARDGIAALRADRHVGTALVAVVASLLFMTATAVADVFFAVDVLGAGEVGYGVLVATWTLGMAAGALVLAPRLRRAALGTGVILAVGVQGAGIAAPGLWPTFAFAVIAAAIGGLAHGTKNVLVRTLIHEGVPAGLRGRAFAAFNGARNGAELVALAGGGVLLTAVGPRSTVLVAGLLPVLVALAALVFLRWPASTPGRLSQPQTNPEPRSSNAHL